MHNNRENTTIAKIALTENVNINYNNTKKIANFNNCYYAYSRKAKEIISNNKTCNIIEHFSIDQERQQILKDDTMCRKKED